MILHRLNFTAFMAYPGEEKIDFDALNDAGIFLLNGPTGSGKTTILDAICYALYGVPSSGREINALYSTHVAPGSVKPQVFLELTVQDRRLRIDRTPAYTRQVTRGKNKGSLTIENPQALVTELIPGKNPEQEDSWRKAAEGMADCAEYLMHLIGLNREQFLKVMLLPQGQFADFLKARSKDRIPLLKQLFPVETYERIMLSLREKEQQTSRAVEDVHHTLKNLHEQAAVTYDKLSHQLSLQEDDTQDTAQDHYGQNNPETEHAPEPSTPEELTSQDFKNWVHDRLHMIHRQEQQDSRALTELRAERERLHREYQSTAQHIQDWAEYERVREGLDRLESRREEQQKRQQKLTLARAAAPLEAARERMSLDEERHNRAQQRAEQTLKAAQEHAHHSLHSLGDDRDYPETALYEAIAVPDFTQALQDSSSVLAQLQRYQQDEGTVDKIRGTLADFQQTADDAQHTIEALDDRERQIKQQLAQLRNTLGTLEAAEQEHARAQVTLEAAQKTFADVSKHAEKLEQAQEENQHAAQEFKKVQQASITAAEKYSALQKRRLEQAAFVLAEELEDGRACMVCGSLEHPHPARAQDQNITRVGQTEIDTAEKHAQDQQQKASTAHSVLAQSQTLLEQLQDINLPSHREAQQAVAQAQDAERQSQIRLKNKRAAQIQQEEFTAELEQVAQQLTQARTKYTQAQTQHADASAQLVELREKLQQAASSISFSERVQALHQHVNLVRQAEDAARLLKESSQQATESREQARGRLQQSAFEDFEEVRLAVISETEEQELERTIAEYREQAAALRAAEERPALQAVAQQIRQQHRAPTQEQLDALKRQQEDTDTRYDVLIARESVRRHGVEALRELAAEHQTYMGEFAQAVEEAELYSGLSRIAQGENPDKNHQVDLVSYVLGGEFEQVLQVASEHLQRMSDQRYRLILSDKREKRVRLGGGLGIMVEDTWNDHRREVSSLSGGETFLASLALALGLAETVQARNGGIEIETLFIDEGFGTLDSETLELVLETLDNIHDRGRVIGLISHVEDMKERIPAHISIEKRQNGSTLRVNV